MAEQTTQPSPSDEVIGKLAVIESKLDDILQRQRVTNRRRLMFDAGLILMVTGLTLVISQLEAITWWGAITYWGIVVFVVGAIFAFSSSRLR